MANQTFGGDDDSSSVPKQEKKKKIPIDKFGLDPDSNLKDEFLKIMASYSATKKPGVNLSDIEGHKYALTNIALSIVLSPHPPYYGITAKFIVQYTITMTLDGNWEDCFISFIEKAKNREDKFPKYIISAIKTICSQEVYRNKIISIFSQMLRDRNLDTIALYFIAKLKNPIVTNAIKKELIILAKGGIGEDQLNAIESVAQITEDGEVKKALITLLSHWDSETRLAAVEAIKKIKDDQEVKNTIIKRIDLETDPQIIKLLKRLSK
jgi:predicted DNA binding protein